MKLFENAEEYMKEQEENNNRIVIEVQDECIMSWFVDFLETNEIDAELKNGYEYITENVHGHAYLKFKGKKNEMEIFFRDNEASGRESKASPHGNSIKIKSPVDLKDVSIYVPSKGDEDKPLRIVGKTKSGKPVTESDIPEICDFVRRNARLLNAVYNSKTNYTKERAIKQMRNKNEEIQSINYSIDDKSNKLNKKEK